MQVAISNRNIINLVLVFLCLCGDVLPKNPYKSGEVRADYPKGCAYLRCKRGDQCVNRKFWCKNPPCPSMLYCSKSRKESLKGPSSCDAVRCSKGFICLVRARRCRWGEACEQQIARCISERDYYEGPASCADFRCPTGHRCILRESFCAKPPCKLLKSCANTKDVNSWFERCKNLGCLSEHECFLRRPDNDCGNSSCKHAPDCLAKSEEELEMMEHCRGWVCPKGEECSTHTEEPCQRDICRISRSCHKHLMIPINSTRPRKHSWKDDIKLSFYSKLDNEANAKIHSDLRLTNNKIFGGSAMGNMKISRTTGSRKIQRPIHKGGFYVPKNARPTSSGPSSPSPDNTSGNEVQPTVTSLSSWLNLLKLKTGVDAIEVWIRKADKQENYGEFRDWLDSVKDMLGPDAYDLWLEEVRAMTVTSTAFQKWLPPAPTKHQADAHRFGVRDEDSINLKNDEPELYPELQNPFNHRSNDDKNFFQSAKLDGREYENGSMRNNDSKEYDYIFPPRNDSPMIKPVIASNNEIPKAPGFPRPTIAANEWSQFYPPDPRIFQQPVYPFQQNFGNIAPWSNQGPFRGFDPTSLMNPWYRQSNLSFPPVNNDFLQPNAWQHQFLPPANIQWQRNGDFRDQFLTDRWIEPLKTPIDVFRRLPEEPAQLYRQNFTNDDTSWTKYFLNPYRSSRFTGADGFGSFPMNDENFDAYVSWPGSNNQETSLLDVPHRRSKHEDSTVESGDSRYADGDEDRSVVKSPGMPEDSRLLYSLGFPWPIVEPRLRDYYRYFVDYNRRNINYKNDPINLLQSPFVADISRTHRPEVEPPLTSLNPYLANNRRDLPRSEYYLPIFHPDKIPRIVATPAPSLTPTLERHEVRGKENRQPNDSFPRLNFQNIDEEQIGGFLFRNREVESPGQPMGVPDLWDPRYRTPLSSIVNKIDEKRLTEENAIGKSVPISSPRRRVASDWIAPVKDENLYRTDYRDEENAKTADFHKNVKENEVPPVLFNLQGYIESADVENRKDFTRSSRNSTILPVYTTDDDTRGRDDCIENHSDRSDDTDYRSVTEYQRPINFFKNPKYEGDPNFPNNLKNVFDIEAAMIMRNITGNSDVEIKDIKWEYEDEEDEKHPGNPSSFPDQLQDTEPTRDELSNINKSRDWIDNTREEKYDDEMEDYYYDEGIDYMDDIVSGERGYFDLEQINDRGAMNHDENRDDSIDRYYDEPEHRRFKKNRPL